MTYEHEDDPKQESRKESCKTCIFYQPIGERDGVRFGECRIRSPQVTVKISAWPSVTEYAWCGEHESNEG